MESPLAVLLAIPDAFVYVGGISGVGALLAILEKQANVFGRIRLERETLKLKQTKAIFERERVEDERNAWRDALDTAPSDDESADDLEGRMIRLELPFKLVEGVLDYVGLELRRDELDE
jgi:hypothetical protein